MGTAIVNVQGRAAVASFVLGSKKARAQTPARFQPGASTAGRMVGRNSWHASRLHRLRDAAVRLHTADRDLSMGLNMRRTLCALIALPWLLHQPALAQQKCDPNLKVRAGDPLGYRERGDRCEGMFVEEVSGTIRVASFHFPRGDFQPRAGTSVRLGWSLPPVSQVQVQAVSLRPRTYFRMDAVLPGSATSYLWPTDFAETVRLKGADIGLLSWTELPIGGRTRRVYSPVSVKDRSGGTELVVVPEAQLEELYYSLVKIDDQGRAEASVVSNRSLRLGVYPSGQPVTIRLPALEPKRIYRLEIAALLKNGGASTRDVYIVNYQS